MPARCYRLPLSPLPFPLSPCSSCSLIPGGTLPSKLGESGSLLSLVSAPLSSRACLLVLSSSLFAADMRASAARTRTFFSTPLGSETRTKASKDRSGSGRFAVSSQETKGTRRSETRMGVWSRRGKKRYGEFRRASSSTSSLSLSLDSFSARLRSVEQAAIGKEKEARSRKEKRNGRGDEKIGGREMFSSLPWPQERNPSLSLRGRG